MAALRNDQQSFQCNLLDWPVERRDRSFQVFVVEPNSYTPGQHGRIFDAAMSAFFRRSVRPVDAYTEVSAALPSVQDFDLITFPEAFLPANHLVGALRSLVNIGSFGCVHVGLRPTESEDNHLFRACQVKK